MKKILLSILLSLVLKEGVSAKTYYSDYSEFSDYSLEKIESSDLVNVEVKRVYNKYFDIVEGNYYMLDENPGFYPIINVNVFKYTGFTEWSIVFPQDKLGRIIECRNVCDNSNCSVNHMEYRYKDKLYFHYREVPILLEENSPLKGYIANEKDYTNYYRYQIRDKINISDEIIITKNSQTINDFIDSTVPYQVIGNIDYSKNDIYTINIVTSFVTIPLKVEVLIFDNIIDKYNKDLLNKNLDIKKLNKEIEVYKNKLVISKQNESSLNKKIEDLQFDINNFYILNTEIKEKNTLLESKINDLYQENDLYQKSILECKNNNDKYELEILKNSSEISLYKKKIFDLNKIIYEKDIENTSKDSIIKDLNNRIDDYELNLSKDNDILKKLNLCNEVNNSLNKKIDNRKTIEKQYVVYILFISIIFFFIGCSILKIKSIKKNN